ncbi:nucleotide-binding protein [Plantibacter sp. ME-Dv--P-122b]|uniref:nucleotide-binding protein n=1 Tax=Plantibacter sp. ME-Dv--P-122b TaxID=3040300 RepID=UPI00330587C5
MRDAGIGHDELPSVFIGSSSEALQIGRYLQLELEHTGSCVATRWDQGVFQASSITIDRLTEATAQSDFAVLVVSADDTVSSRGVTRPVARDNVVFELGLFIGALGRERTYIVADRSTDLHLPTDLMGVTWLPYTRRQDGNQRAALNEAVLGIVERIGALGPRTQMVTTASASHQSDSQRILRSEIERVCRAAEAQGWRVRTRSETTLRIEDRRRRRYTLSLDDPAAARMELRLFAAQLRANGLRISQSVRRPVQLDRPLP